MSKFIDLTGQKFGRLTVIERVSNSKHSRSMWLCKCDCGIEKIILGNDLHRNHTKSCGCLRKETTRQRFTKHGHSKKGKVTKIYSIWLSMIQRCTNPKNKNYHHYGGRGITVCKRWSNSFENFNKDMAKEWKLKLTIERKNNDKGYCKNNCYWATWSQQQRNKRNNRLISYLGKSQCIAAWAEEMDIPDYIIDQRIKRGWDIAKALETPVRKKH